MLTDLRRASAVVSERLRRGRADLDEARVAFFVTPGFDHVAIQWGIWRAGGVAVPLPLTYPAPELEYLIRDADASVLVVDPPAVDRLMPVAASAGVPLQTTTDLLRGWRGPEAASIAAVSPDLLPINRSGRRAMILYTSGTTGKPKGVVTTHANIAAQIQTVVSAWEWTAADRALLVLPLHHVHGIINVVCSALWSGAACEIHPRFEPEAAWERLASGELTVFSAVPTIYHRLIESWDAAPGDLQRQRSEGSRTLRLMMSGSSALPKRVLERWEQITGHRLLERYGMSEVAMALSNPLHGDRRPGYVGSPLPGVSARLVSETGEILDRGPGEIQLKGAGVFREYWRRPDETAAAFDGEWFRTGDMAVIEDGYFRLLGRRSVDIIKTGAEKVSALEIEEVLRSHPAIAECAVVGVADAKWGERVCAAVELQEGARLTLDELRGWARTRLAPSKVPRELQPVARLPRNALGKVVKPELVTLFAPPPPPAPPET